MRKNQIKKMMAKEADRVLADKKPEFCTFAVKKTPVLRRFAVIAAAALLAAALIVPLGAAVLMKKPAQTDAPPPDDAPQPAATTLPASSGTTGADTRTDPAETPTIPRVPTDDGPDIDVPAYYRAVYSVRRAYRPDEDGQAALEWLKTDGGLTYPKMNHLVSRYDSEIIETEEGVYFLFDTTPFVVWGLPDYRNFYYFFEIDAAELHIDGDDFLINVTTEDYPYVFEFWYKTAGSDEDYRGIRTAPTTRAFPYVYQYNETTGEQFVVFRVPTYNEGIRDLSTDNGEPVDYEFIIVIRDLRKAEDEDVVGWGEITVTIDTQYEEHLRQAFAEGLLELPQ